MTNILILNRTIEIQSLDNDDVIGYGFASAGDPATDPAEEAVVHRWFLMTRDTSLWPPNNRVRFKEPADQDWRITDKASFVARVRAKFDGQPSFYVKGNCKVQPNDMGPPVTIHRPIAPPDLLGPEPGAGEQTDVGVCPILLPNDTVLGYVLTVRTDTAHTLEYWALLSGYHEPDLTHPVELGRHLGTSAADLPFLLDSVTWSASCTFIACACTYYIDMGRIAEGRE